MLRFIVAIAVGYLVLIALVILAFSLSIVAPDFAFERDSYEVTTGWLVYTVAARFVAAVAGGFVAVLIGRRRSIAHALAALALVLGLGGAVSNLKKERPPEDASAAEVSMKERNSRAVEPNWYAFSLPFIGAAGIVVGGRLRKEKRR